jgi:hypothetical protein
LVASGLLPLPLAFLALVSFSFRVAGAVAANPVPLVALVAVPTVRLCQLQKAAR